MAQLRKEALGRGAQAEGGKVLAGAGGGTGGEGGVGGEAAEVDNHLDGEGML